MKLVECKAELIQQKGGLEGLYRHIETCGRVPYKSEGKSDGTIEGAKAFVGRILKAKHNAVLEHGTVYLHYHGCSNILSKYNSNPYSRCVEIYDHKTVCQDDVDYYYHYYVTTNYRVLVENGWLDDLHYMCEPTEYHVKRYTFKVVTSIGVTREFNRHRVLSILEQSTRYCNFSTDKFDNQVSFCKPSWLDLNLGTYERVDNNKDLGDVVGDGYIKNVSNRDEDNLFLTSCLFAEDTYKELIEDGWKPQQAREILPLCTATEAVYTGFTDQWNHFFCLRYLGTTGAPHPNMKELTVKMKEVAEKAGIWENITIATPDKDIINEPTDKL